jgi:hypothetical protein
MLHLVVDALCLLAGIAILLWRGFRDWRRLPNAAPDWQARRLLDIRSFAPIHCSWLFGVPCPAQSKI